MTPCQLWVYGLNHLNDNHASLEESNYSMYGADFEGPLPSQMYDGETFDEIAIEVPPVASPLNDNQLNLLSSTVNPLASSSSYGLDIYLNTVQMVNDLLQSGTANHPGS